MYTVMYIVKVAISVKIQRWIRPRKDFINILSYQLGRVRLSYCEIKERKLWVKQDIQLYVRIVERNLIKHKHNTTGQNIIFVVMIALLNLGVKKQNVTVNVNIVVKIRN